MAIETQLSGRVFHIRLNRPEKRNALDIATCREIVSSVRQASSDRRVGAVLLSGAGPAFCAGMDLREAPGADLESLGKAHDELFTLGQWSSKPVIAAVHGPALAGGTGLAANAHIVIASEDAQFGLTEIHLGLWPVLIFPAIAAAVGERRAVELALTARRFGAREAESYGLAARVVPLEDLMATASELAQGIAAASLTALEGGLEYLARIRGKSAAEALHIGRDARARIMGDPDFAEGLAAFREKRRPKWPSHAV